MARRHDEDGAIAPFVGIILTVLLLIAALVIDIGMQRVGRADMQALSDVVALDLARELDGRTVGTLTANGMATSPGGSSLANLSRDRNQDVIGYDTSDPPRLTIFLGEMVDGEFVDHSGSASFVPTAVRVIANTNVDFAFAGITDVQSGNTEREAVAQANGGACFAIGSYAARLNTTSSPILGPLLGALGSNISLSAIDYNGLANADVDVAELLAVDLGAGTIEEALTSSIGLGSFYLAIANALDGSNTAQIALLQSIAATVGPAQVALSNILGVTTGSGSGLDATLNVLDLVTAAAAAANGTNAVIARPSVNLGPVANVGVNLTAIEAPRMGCGRKNDSAATARSTQVRVELNSSLADVTVPGLLRTRVALSGTVEVASADGQLTDVRCSPPGATVAVTDGLLRVNLTLQVTVYARVLGISIPVVGGPIRITGETSSSGQAVINITNDADYDNPVTVGNGSAGLPTLTANTSGLALIGLPVGVLLAPIVNSLVTGLVNPLVSALDTVLLSPLLNSLGLDVSGADVYLRRVPVCSLPRLVG